MYAEREPDPLLVDGFLDEEAAADDDDDNNLDPFGDVLEGP